MNFKTLQSRLVSILNKPIVRGTFWMFLAQGMRIFVQGAYFVLIARTLGSEQYGAFVGVAALVGLISPFCSLGSQHILVKQVSRQRHLLPEYWGNALFMTLVSSVILAIVTLGAAQRFLPQTISPWLVLLIALADMVFLKIIDTAGKAFLACDLTRWTAKVELLKSVKNLMAALCLVSFFTQPSILVWGAIYCGSTAFTALVLVLLVGKMLGTPKLALQRIKPELTEGFYFSVSSSAHKVNKNLDKTMLAQLASLEATGIYAAAYRLIDVAFTPILSLLGAAYSKFFRQGTKGIRGSLELTKKLIPIAIVYGLVATVSLFFIAPVIPQILGEQYTNAVEALRWLAPLLLLKSLQYFASDTLTGAGFQGLRSAMQVSAALFNLLLNLYLIPLYSWKGAAWASLASDGLLLIGLWIIVVYFERRSSQSANL